MRSSRCNCGNVVCKQAMQESITGIYIRVWYLHGESVTPCTRGSLCVYMKGLSSFKFCAIIHEKT